MIFLPNTEFPDGIYVIHQPENNKTVVTELALTQSGGTEDAFVCQLRGMTLPMDMVGDESQPVLFDPDTITKVEQITENRYHFMKEMASQQLQMKQIENAIRLQKAVEVGRSAGLVSNAVDHGPEANEVQPSQCPTPDSGPVAADVAEAPFAPKTVAAVPPTPNRDEEVAEHTSTLMDIPLPGQ